jgi:hypothetical protein
MLVMSNKPNKTTAQVLDQKIIDAVDKHFAKVKTLTLAGLVYSPATLKAALQAEIDATRALDQVSAQSKQSVAVLDDARAKAFAARKALKAYILGNFGGPSAVRMLEDFGMNMPKEPSKRRPKKATPAEKPATTPAPEPPVKTS